MYYHHITKITYTCFVLNTFPAKHIKICFSPAMHGRVKNIPSLQMFTSISVI